MFVWAWGGCGEGETWLTIDKFKLGSPANWLCFLWTLLLFSYLLFTQFSSLGRASNLPGLSITFTLMEQIISLT